MLDEYDKYQLLREQLIKTAVSFSRNITAFALLEEQSDLFGMFGFSPNDLPGLQDEELIKRCNLMLGVIQEFNKDLNDYGINEENAKAFRLLTDRLKLTLKSTVV
ncbi:MAG: hypothetical protein Q8928_00960 [Bacteroidota bacterium]|nr:hypothetical protein [Bacteroidota bacterium]